jgi:hypothetical protein
MFGVGLLVGLGRRLVAQVAADTGLLPAGYYRHRVLAALEEEDFEAVLRYLPWAGDPVLTQVVILRLRLLRARHEQRREVCRQALGHAGTPPQQARLQEVLAAEARAAALLREYEGRAKGLLPPPSEDKQRESGASSPARRSHG